MTRSVNEAGRDPRVPSPSAVVIGLDTITGLQTCRILARRGVRVVAIAADRRHPACRTNTCSRLVITPTEGEPLIAALEELATAEAGAVLFPCTDGSVRTLARASGRLESFRPVLPAWEIVDALCDERRFAEFVEAHGLPVPPTRIVTDAETARRAADDLAFPCYVKPTVVTPSWKASGPVVRCFDDASAWLDASPRLLELHPELVLQERMATDAIPERYSCSWYVSPHGLPILTFVTRSLRQWPPRLGFSCLEEAVEDLQARHLGMEVASRLPFAGIGTVESERDPKTGIDRILGITVGRPNHRTGIAEAAGVEVIDTMYRDAIGAPLPIDRRQQPRRVKWVHVTDDLRSARAAIRARELTLSGWLLSLRGRRVYAVLDVGDLLPFATDVVQRLQARIHPRSESPALGRNHLDGLLAQMAWLGRRQRALRWAVALLPSWVRTR